MNWTENKVLIELEKEVRMKRNECRREYKCYFGAANNYRNKHTLFGVTALILGTLAGSGFIARATIEMQYLTYFASLFSLVAALFTGLITFNRYSERAVLFEKSGRNWENIRDKYSRLLLEIYSVETEKDIKKLLSDYDNLSTQRLKIREDSVGYPGWLFKKFEHLKDKTEEITNANS